MKKTFLVILFTGLIGASLLWAQDKQSDQKMIDELKARLQALEERVKTLEQKTEPKQIALPHSQLPPKEKPPGKPFEFNGQTYYIVPLKQGDAVH